LHEIEEYLHYQIPKQEVPSEEQAAEGKMTFNNRDVIEPIIKKDKS
jgi:ATP-dependent RNA helicase DeaD